ncbi:MAG TPA: B12-binding domain-containing radical SAM protein [Anaeromyxobacteraceae bacterium]|nr:B12-binding domain-containing radical SAM protein [Anaeromyxobacteraceae bacterium]
MRALLVQGASPPTYWGFQYALPFIAKDAAFPPLGLATLAAFLPESWELRVRDLHLGSLSERDLCWADAVLVTGTLVQAGSMREVLAQARRLGVPTVVGGPAPTTSPDRFPEATYLFLGETEGRIARLIEALEQPGRVSERILSPRGDAWPSMELARVPRFDLLEIHRYASCSIQVSRGCPFNCEFCDIIEIFGRVSRVKRPEQVLRELEALYRLGARGSLFVVDDNFIGNRKAAARLLSEVAAWQRDHGMPFDMYTEASLDLASDPALVESMVNAGFGSVFVGIESSEPKALREAQKKQNLRLDPAQSVRILSEAGLEVLAGFIVGFDSDDAGTLARQREFVSQLPIPRAMVGILTALPGTQLSRRLERQGRLRADASGDQFDRPNFETAMPELELVEGYRQLLAALFTPDAFFKRCQLSLEIAPPPRAPFRGGGLRTLARAVWGIGICGERERRHWFWRLLIRAIRLRWAAVPQAVAFSILGEHFIRYTAEEVVPRLDRRIEEIRRELAGTRSGLGGRSPVWRSPRDGPKAGWAGAALPAVVHENPPA